MGLTHYWRRHQAFPRSNFQHAVKDIRLACQLTRIPLAGMDGSGSPHFSTQLISFNGQGNLSCESFHFPRTSLNPTPRPTNPASPTHIFEFCKTNGHPYDFCIQLCLIILHHHLNVDHTGPNDTSHSPPPLQIESDRNQDYWNNAIRFVSRYFHYGQDFRLTPGQRPCVALAEQGSTLANQTPQAKQPRRKPRASIQSR